MSAARAAALVVLLAALAPGCGGGGGGTGERAEVLVAVDAPFSRGASVGEPIANGAALAAAEVNGAGGARAPGGGAADIRVRRYDNAGSTRRAVENVRRALDAGAVAIVTDGTGVDAYWRLAAERGVAVCIVYDGAEGLIDPAGRPNVFRIAPTDHGIAFRLAEHIVPKGLRVAVVHDDSGYGLGGKEALDRAFESLPGSVAARVAVPAGDSDLSPQVARARRSGATALLVWGRPDTVAAALLAARTSGWDVPVFTPPSGADPFVRQQLADHPAWVDGLTFASGRLTAEAGPELFASFASRYESSFGADPAGVRTRAGAEVLQPPEWAMYSYDFVKLLRAALDTARDRDGLVAALEQVTVSGSNGDERGFNERNHEGVIDDDVYFAQFRDMTFAPVRDDPLSATLPAVPQTR